MKSSEDLRRMLRAVDHKSYPAYKDLRGAYSFGSFVLGIDHVQGDPFASPSRLSVQIDGAKAAFPPAYYKEKHCRIALQDYLNRLFYQEIEKYTFKARGSGKSGLIAVSRCGQEILERSAVTIRPSDGQLLVRFCVGFPANGRTINASQLERILFEFLPSCVTAVLFYRRLPAAKVQSVIHLAQDQQFIRSQLEPLGLCAFVANGSVLPRQSGVSDRPMKDGIPFVSPKSMEVTLSLPHHGPLSGMGIRKGITLIVGGGYHGKSTLLEALELGVYNHIAGDGREYVITDDSALKIRAEDGRSIKKTDISMFINNLPNKKDTRAFYSEDASGSTSQAANVIEGMESGARVFLIDEDTCATNFMIRDELMQRVVCREEEPITPFIERARFLYEKCGISSILVAGSSGAYFYIADTILQMDRYVPKDITEFARKEAAKYAAASAAGKHPDAAGQSAPGSAPSSPVQKLPDPALPSFRRIPSCNMALRRDDRLKTRTRGTDDVQLGHENIDLRYLEQIADHEQTAALSCILALAEKNLLDGRKTLTQLVDDICALMEEKGLAGLSAGGFLSTDLAMPRRQEIFACFNRYRGLRL
ncbi:MAG TPA: ABC-ATPase domain-containing protein [Candidatus Eisenbergiella intestinipullorum]|nr:ABC-ATPase domain-containing protein [Candidatus Eisenbergiella intestinipullorum]